MNLSNELVESIRGVEMTALRRERAKLCLLDYVGCAMAGAAHSREKTLRLWVGLGAGGEVRVIGLGRTASVQCAALINGIHAHVLELDDGERFGMMHPGAPVISALLPLAEADLVSGSSLLKGIVLGYEAALKVAGALQPGLKDRGFHATGVCGAIGAALGGVEALGLSVDQAHHALSAAAAGASGLLKMIRDRSEMKAYNAGHAAMIGITAVRMAQAGFVGPDDVLAGDEGFLAMHGVFDRDLFCSPLDNLPGIERIYVKPYAACRHCHAPIQAALTLRSRERLSWESIETIRVATHRWAVHLHDHTDIEGTVSAKMSIPYGVAVALVAGNAGLDEFDETWMRRGDVQGLTRKVAVHEDPEMTSWVPRRRAARVDITLKNGRTVSEQVDLPKGEPETPLTTPELMAKYNGLMAYAGKSAEQATAIADCILDAENRLDELWKMIA